MTNEDMTLRPDYWFDRCEAAEAKLAAVEALCNVERLPHIEFMDRSVPVADRRSVLRPVVFVHDVLAAARGEGDRV